MTFDPCGGAGGIPHAATVLLRVASPPTAAERA